MSTAADEEMELTISVPGREPVETTLGGLSRAAQYLQLSFDVGGDDARPTGASLAIGGKGDIRAELYMDDDVTIRVIDARGEIVAEFQGTVAAVNFVKHKQTETEAAWVERAHKIKLEA